MTLDKQLLHSIELHPNTLSVCPADYRFLPDYACKTHYILANIEKIYFRIHFSFIFNQKYNMLLINYALQV